MKLTSFRFYCIVLFYASGKKFHKPNGSSNWSSLPTCMSFGIDLFINSLVSWNIKLFFNVSNIFSFSLQKPTFNTFYLDSQKMVNFHRFNGLERGRALPWCFQTPPRPSISVQKIPLHWKLSWPESYQIWYLMQAMGNTLCSLCSTYPQQGGRGNGLAVEPTSRNPKFDSSSQQPQVVAYQHWACWITE